MRTKVIINSSDICMVCDDCDYLDDIYHCPKLNKHIEQKSTQYVWCWIKNDN